VFAYIDEISDASVSGHADELAMSGRVQQRRLERLVVRLLEGASETELKDSAERADWTPPQTFTAVVLSEVRARALRGLVDARTLQLTDDVPSLDIDSGLTVLLVPNATGRSRRTLLRVLGDDAVVGPPRPWLDARSSFLRAAQAHRLGFTGDTDAHLADLVVRADPDAMADLRARALAPLASLKPTAQEKLTDTLRAWLLHHGRRDEVAAVLFVHPQTVRYRMGQLRELYGDRLEDPQTVLELTIALA
jgi:hypothetical protein